MTALRLQLRHELRPLRPEQVRVTRAEWERAVIHPDSTLTRRERHVLLTMSAMGAWTLSQGGTLKATCESISRGRGSGSRYPDRHPPMPSLHAFCLPLHVVRRSRWIGP